MPTFCLSMRRELIERIVIALLLGALAARASAKPQTLYVAPNGDDRWSGAQPEANEQRTDGPLRSLSAALQQSRQARRHGAGEVQILLRGGAYTMGGPLVLTAEDSGLVIAAFRHESPVISGRTVIGGWKCSRLNPNIWQTEIADARNGNWIFHELFVNGQRKERTRIPEQGFFHYVGASLAGRPAELQFHPGDIQADWARSGDVELIAFACWAQSRNQIREVFESSNIVSLAGGALPNTCEPNGRFYIENAPVELRPGQWHLDLHGGLLSYWPDAGEDVPNATINAPHLYELVQIKGEAGHPAHHITFRGITFADTDWRFDGGSDTDVQAAVETPGAVQARFARDCTFERCAFQRLGGYALELDRGCEQDKIIGNEMHDLGAGGIRVGEAGLDQSIRWPCRGHVITDNHVHHIGLVNAPAAGIFVLLSGQNQIAHNEVDHTYYTAISVGWSWGYAETPCRGNRVEFNHLHDIGQGMLSDMGGVYTLGVQPRTVVRNNLIHDVNAYAYGGWGLYTDEGSSGIVLENNVVYRCQSAGFHQHYGRENVIRNNIFAFNKEAQLMRTRIEPHLSFIFTNNIVYFDAGWLLGGNWGDDLQMDHNIYFDTRAITGGNQTRETLSAWQKRGHDLHSLFVDPLFAAPRREDFHLKPNSPALRFGFRQIDLSGVGVRPGFRRP
jgi:parallel beta-helix repeat protein